MTSGSTSRPPGVSTVAIDRATAVRQVLRRIESIAHPRLQMAVIVAFTGAVGAVSSVAMLQLGIDSMAVRYLLATACAYLCFVAILRCWMRIWSDDWLDVADLVPSPGVGGGSPDAAAGFHGGGGDFAGGGASGSFDAPAGPSMPGPSTWPTSTSPSISSPATPSSSFDGGECGGIDAGDATLPLLIAATAIAVACASLYVVWIAPGLLAELLFDGVLSYTLYRHLRPQRRRHWLSTALRRTALPFACTAVFLSGTGLAMAVQVPCARSIADVVHQVKGRRSTADVQATRATARCVRRVRHLRAAA